MADSELHIGFEIKPDQSFNEKIGWLALKKAGSIKVWVKEYKEERKQKISEFESRISPEEQELEKELQTIEEEQRRSDEFIYKNYEDAKAGKVRLETYNANLAVRQKDNKIRENRRKEINDKLKELRNFEKSEEGEELKKKYSKVRWVWQLIGSDRPKLTKDSFNEAITSGKTELNLTFDDFLEGGGAAYLEPFWEGEIPKGKYPNGIIINAKNNNSKIITADWRDKDDNLITEIIADDNGVAFGSVVYLNIYTQNLYGHNIKIQLKDKDNIIRFITFGLMNADDELFAAEYLNNGIKVEDRVIEDIDKKAIQFIRPVSLHTTKKHPSNAKHGILVDGGDDPYDNKVSREPNVQKCKFAVFIDPLWEDIAGKKLLIYPEIEHPHIPNGIKSLTDCNLKVTKKGTEISTIDIDSNMVAVISNVETNMEFFKHCKYTSLKGNYKGGNDTEFFNTEDPKKRFVSDIAYKVVAGKEKENQVLRLEIPDLKTENCSFEDDPEKDHKTHAIKIDENISYPDLEINDNNISFSVSYPEPSIPVGESMMIQKNVKPIKYPIDFVSCAIRHHIEVQVYPAVSYELGFKLGTENPFCTKSSESYVERDYLGNWGFFDKRTNKNIRKEQQSQRKKNYKNNQQEVSSGRLKYDQFEYFLDYAYDDVKQSSISLEAEYPIINIIDTVMWIVNTISLLSFEKEADEALKEHKKERPKQVRKRKKKRKKRQGKNKSKFPFKIEIGQPTFAGSVKWNYESSQKETGEIGMLYTINLKADPLIYVKGSLDLLFVATKIPYVGQIVYGLTAVADTVGSADDFWNTIVDFFGGGDKYKINIDVDYFLDLYVSGDINLALETLKYHTVDRFSWGGELSCSSDIKFGIECGGSLKLEIGEVYSMSAKIEGKAEAVWEIKVENNTLICEYQGLYAIIETNLETNDRKSNSGGNDGDDNPDTKKFLLHDGFSYEFKLD